VLIRAPRLRSGRSTVGLTPIPRQSASRRSSLIAWPTSSAPSRGTIRRCWRRRWGRGQPRPSSKPHPCLGLVRAPALTAGASSLADPRRWRGGAQPRHSEAPTIIGRGCWLVRAPLARCCRALLIRRIVYALQVGHMRQVRMIISIELDIVQILNRARPREHSRACPPVQTSICAPERVRRR
jgi:hypothetical protein